MWYVEMPCGRQGVFTNGVVYAENIYNDTIRFILNPNTQKVEYIRLDKDDCVLSFGEIEKPPKLKKKFQSYSKAHDEWVSLWNEKLKEYRKALPADYLTPQRWLQHTGWITFQIFPCHYWIAMCIGNVLGGKIDEFNENNKLVESRTVDKAEILAELAYYCMGSIGVSDNKLLEETAEMACYPY